MKYIGFFLSAQDIDEKYKEPALELVRLIVTNGYGFVYGGSEKGLMRESAKEVLQLKGKMIAVTCEEFKHVVTQAADETICAKNIGERKHIILQKSDAIIALPGGSGTLDEITDIIEGRKLDLHDKPIVFLNTEGFWDGLITQYTRMIEEGFLPKKLDQLFYSSDDPKEIMKYLQDQLG